MARLINRTLSYSLLSTLLFLLGTNPVHAVEYGELVQKDGKWEFKNTEDPVLKLMHDKQVITEEEYFNVTDRQGQNWIEPADAILNRRKDIDWNRYLKTGLHLPDWVELGLEQRTRFESYDHPWRAAQKIGQGSTDAQIPMRSRLRVGFGGDGPLRFLFEGQDSRSFLLDTPHGAFRDTTMVNEFDVLQLFGAFKMDNVLGTGLRTDVLFGRFTMDLGNRRMVARNDFRNTTNAFDGFLWQLSQPNAWRLKAFATETVQRDDSSLDTDNKKSLFWGTYLESQPFRWFHLDAYYLGLNDRRVATVSSHRTYATFGGRLFKEPKPGELDYEIETTWQIGHRGVAKHFAHFQHIDIGYMFNLPWTPRLLFHFDYASGDHKPNDGQDGGFDTLFGARNFEYMPTSTWGPFYRTNLITPGWRVILTPSPSWILEVKHRIWYLADNTDVFGQSGLRDTTGKSGGSLGHDVQLRARWAISQNIDFDFGYVHWFKGSYFDNAAILNQMPTGGNKDSDYFYAQMRVRI